ncbi:MAG: hypothetical protein B6242_08270 [Anaerolineaceae bacterium 4572_78]|nr:MAG: hypothetical protein B6242_08270 [Anaerolineaceae bacterium 4572_78]
MYLKKITIKNVKCFDEIEIDFMQGKNPRLWTTLFGKNGLGKSTILQAIAVTLAGPGAMRELLPVAKGWVRGDKPYGEIIGEILWTESDLHAPIKGHGKPKTKSPYKIQYLVIGNDIQKLPKEEEKSYHIPLTIVPWSGQGTPKQKGNLTKDINRLRLTMYTENKKGWLACGYGPFRRLSGGSQDADKILYSGRIAARFVTLFREDAALTNVIEWLVRLYNTARDGDKKNKKALNYIKKAFVENFFPEPVTLHISARDVHLELSGKPRITLQDLSDGYRSMLALGIDLLRWLIQAFPDSDNPMHESGVVLIDELDTHLHPQWQRYIGHWLREKFPKIQFIVATHSPFLAQVADVDSHGLIAPSDKIKQESGNLILESDEHGVKIHPSSEAVGDLRIDQILQSPLFDVSIISPKTEAKLSRHESLHQKKSSGATLSKNEEKDYQQLTMWRENLPVQSDLESRQREQKLNVQIDNLRDELSEIE